MSLVRTLARPLLAATFVVRGVDALMHPMTRAERAQPLADRLGERVSAVPKDGEFLVRATGGVMVGAGTLLAAGKAPRLASLALVVASLPSTYVDHPFWEVKDPERRRDERGLFLREVSLVGGLLLASVDTEGRPGLAWRGRHVVGEVERSAGRASRRAKRASRQATREARHLRRQARLEAREVVRSAQSAASDALPV